MNNRPLYPSELTTIDDVMVRFCEAKISMESTKECRL